MRELNMANRYWLFKTEPGDFSIEDLKARPDQTEPWDGVRNHQARNFLRDTVRVGDRVLLYHSGTNPSVVGTARIARAGYPDHTALDPDGKHFDPRSTPDQPVWYMVDVRLEAAFPRPIPLARLRQVAGLENMLLLRKGMRLSVQPVTENEFNLVVALANPEPAPVEDLKQ
jgi:predicted RNA-binding protein with PUA-like domain